MPIVVDHEQRRREVAEIAADLIAKLGVERVTVREVAAAAGCSTTVVSHYFRDKRELQLMAYRIATLRARRRIEAELALDGPDRLQRCIEAMLPLDEPRRRDWHVWFAFWGVAVSDPQFAAEQKLRARYSRELVERLLLAAPRAPESRGAPTSAQAAESLVAFVVGIAGQALFDPDLWPPARQSAVLRAELRLLGCASDASGGGDAAAAASPPADASVAPLSVPPAVPPGPPPTANGAPARAPRARPRRTRARAR